MSIIGIGTDIVELARISAIFVRRGEQFKQRILTAAEMTAAAGRPDSVTFCAGRWAAKEACSKALGCGIGASCSFTDIKILNNRAGRPSISLSGAALATFKSLGGKAIHISISHERNYAVATVVIEGE